MEKYINEDGKVGVIVSCGYGAGWSTWGENSEFLAMDKTLVGMCLESYSVDDVEKYLKSKGFDNYTGGWSDCKVEFVDKGTLFIINEYDGSESLEVMEDIGFMRA